MKTIVVIDDEPVILEYLFQVLSKDFKVEKFNNPSLAISFIESNKPDLVITDIQMPKMNGITLSETLREIVDMPILLMSANDFSTGHIKNSSFIKKPFMIKDIKKTVLDLIS